MKPIEIKITYSDLHFLRFNCKNENIFCEHINYNGISGLKHQCIVALVKKNVRKRLTNSRVEFFVQTQHIMLGFF